MIPTFVIFLREGIEASMIVAILLAYLDGIGQRRYFRDVYTGVGAAMLLILVGGIAAYVFVKSYDGSTVQTVFETVTYVVAAVALTYMTFWMQSHAANLTKELQRRSDDAISSGSRLGMFALAFTSVGREGLETMVFTLAIVFANAEQAATSRGSTRQLILGAVVGLAVALACAAAIYRFGRRMNMRRFFRVLGLILMFFAAGLVADAVENMQQLGWLPWGRSVVWDTSTFMSEASSVGDVFHSLLGYADQPTVLQVIAWCAYLAIAGGLYARRTRGRRPPAPVAASASGRAS